MTIHQGGSFACLAAMVIAMTSCGGGTTTGVESTTVSSPKSVTVSESSSNASPSAPDESAVGPVSELPVPADVSEAGAEVFRLGKGVPDWLSADGDNVWIAGDKVGEGVARLNADGELDLSVPVGYVCAAMDVGYGSLWVPDCDEQEVLRVDLSTGRVIARIAVPGEGMFDESSVAAGENGVWVLSGITHPQLVRIDPSRNRVASMSRMPRDAAAVRSGLGAVWVTVAAVSGQLLQVNPRDGLVQSRIEVGADPQFLAVGAGSVWVMNQFDGTVSRVDPRRKTVTATVHVADLPITGGDIAAASDSVWVRVTDALAVEIDPATNEISARLGPSVGSGSTAIGSHSAWFSVEVFNTIYRIPQD